MESGNIPMLAVSGRTLPEVWENSLLELWQNGVPIRTEYDRPEDPPSRDCTMVMLVEEPFAEPRIHRAFPAGLQDLEIYRQEVVDGVHDSWIAPEEGKWTYTYHQRLFCYPLGEETIDQMNYIIEKLSQVDYTRRAQAITWNPKLDPSTYDPPCLQRVWFRILKNHKGEPVLNMNTHWRSRDAYKAAFMNMFALTELQKYVAEKISQLRTDWPKVTPGRYLDISDSYHIYGSYFEEFKGFLETVEKRTFQHRTWTTKFAEPFFQEARERLKRERESEQVGDEG
ncbi:MAG: hypothetical protein DRQ02_00750 [Candidatus Latescibacterota bacterium]|nr:MAG: hypothetical protein DRQ02_00750 [Candidatus Latescibacterota bacterium]RKY71228.1 MAG: hypothetical protein DRQ24_07805 [Candidatus Latescibacterota bacterium]